MNQSRQSSSTGWLATRFALREMRGGLSGFVVFLACIALGVAAWATTMRSAPNQRSSRTAAAAGSTTKT